MCECAEGRCVCVSVQRGGICMCECVEGRYVCVMV